MKIKTRIILYFTVTIFLTGVIFLVAAGFASNYTIENNVGKYNAIIATETASAMDRIIYRRIERWESYINSNSNVTDALKASNQKFSAMSDEERNAYIANIDQDWVNQDPDAFNTQMSQIIDSDLSAGLRDRIKFYNDKYGYKIFPEAFITNKYGVLVMSTGRTSDYNQADEDWWQTTKADGIYVGNIEYDESAGTNSLPLNIKVNDSNGNFLGVIKVVYNIQDVYEVAQDIKDQKDGSVNTHESLNSLNIYILDSKDNLIYSMNGNQLGLKKEELDKQINDSNGKNFFTTRNDAGKKTFYAYATEEGYKDYKGLGWKVIISYDSSEIFSSITMMGELLVVIFFLSLIITFVIALYLSRRITKPVEQLSGDVNEYIKGNFSHKSNLKVKDEFGDISIGFNQMAEAIIKSRAEVDRKVKEQTEEIVQKQKDLENQQKATMNVLEDVEEEKVKTTREKDKIDTILHSIGDAVFVVDEELKIILINQITIDLSGFSREELIGKKYDDILQFVFESSGKINDKFINNAMSTGEIQEMSNHTLLVSKNGKKIPVADSAAPLKNKDGKIVGCVVVFRDVTRERQIDQAKTEFVSLASHQLRTPLSAINWYTEMLINGDAGKLTTDQKKYLDEIYKGNQRMVNLVNALLDVSRIELGTFAVEPEKIKIEEISQQIIKEIKLDADKKSIELKDNYQEKLPEIMADPKLVQIVIQNLLSNAVKYTPEKGKVSLSVKSDESNLIIEVKDTGYGIPPNQKDQIFKKLFRADNVRAKDTEGTGLGLYIVKSIVEQSGGKIWFESAENKGTTFFVSIPLKGMAKKEGTKALEDIK